MIMTHATSESPPARDIVEGLQMDHDEVGRLWNGNADLRTRLARDGFDGTKAGGERTRAGVRLCWCPPGAHRTPGVCTTCAATPVGRSMDVCHEDRDLQRERRECSASRAAPVARRLPARRRAPPGAQGAAREVPGPGDPRRRLRHDLAREEGLERGRRPGPGRRAGGDGEGTPGRPGGRAQPVPRGDRRRRTCRLPVLARR
jgi:hypothetical protein